MPIAAAFGGQDWEPPEGGVSTVAGGIAVERPPRLGQALDALGDSGGSAVAVGGGGDCAVAATVERFGGVVRGADVGVGDGGVGGVVGGGEGWEGG